MGEIIDMENARVLAGEQFRLWLGDDGIVRIIWAPGAQVTMQDAEESMALYLEIYGGRSRPMLVDTKQMKSLDREARHYYASEYAASVASAVGIIVGTPVSRVLGNFYLGLSNPQLPTRLFSAEDEALEWLKGYIE